LFVYKTPQAEFGFEFKIAFNFVAPPFFMKQVPPLNSDHVKWVHPCVLKHKPPQSEPDDKTFIKMLLGALLLKSQFTAQFWPFHSTALFVCGEEREELVTMPHVDIGSDVNRAFAAATRPDFNQHAP